MSIARPPTRNINETPRRRALSRIGIGLVLLLSACGEVNQPTQDAKRQTVPSPPRIVGHWKATIVLDDEATRTSLRKEGLAQENIGGEMSRLRKAASKSRLTVVFNSDGTLTTVSNNSDGSVTTHTEHWEVVDESDDSVSLKLTREDVERRAELRFLDRDTFEIGADRDSLVKVVTFKRQTEDVLAR